ncbi:purine-binding chemotaxis protein CheW [Geoalkalibacter ferrihydriticus]|uniref:Purine-binding chemotaxis protein CheW n=1 Tax=Geoalkalibacter ferrihydriticus TaxID=392333 RepID=A0A1G9MYC5_9BACT|nr:chemotaxis protein CheW [Geoalkalibacter ferrihydriticus]SDL79272.1 purine-binding chemotaxis protein CheW [Geoalkalibacter ferrihydriticus]
MGQILIFGLAGELYGLEIRCVQEVVVASRLHPVPRAPAALLGAINFHGSVVPVLDLGAWLGFPGSARDPRVIVLADAQARLALAVDHIRRIVSPAADEIFSCADAEAAEYCIQAVFHWDGAVVNLLDVARLTASLESLAVG